MNFGLVLSISLHLVVALMLTLELYNKPFRMHEQETIVVDLIQIEEKSNVKTTKHKAPIKTTEQKLAEKFYKNREQDVNTKVREAEEVKKPKKVEEPKKVVEKPVEKKVEKKVEKVIEEAQKPPPPPVKVAEQPKPIEPKPEPTPEPQQISEVKKPTMNEKQKPKTVSNFTTKSSNQSKAKIQSKSSKKREIDSFAKSVMETLDVNTAKNRQYKSSISDVLGKSDEVFDPEGRISLSEVNYIRHKISQNWNTTYFASISAMDLGADIFVILNPDGSIKHVEVESSHGRSLPQYQLFLDSVLSAVWKASPLDQLQQDHFDAWHEIVISFDPSGMVW